MSFKGKVVLVTGAAGNLGRAVAQAFAEQGAALVLVDLDRKRLQQVHGDDNETQLLAAADLRSAAPAAEVVKTALSRFGRIDVLANIAGGFRMGETVHESSDETWQLMFDLNLRTLLNMSHAVVPAMLSSGSGRIVNIGANGALRGGALMGAYAATKSGVIRLTESMAAELGKQGINVNCVLPTIIDTPENRAAMPDADTSGWVAPVALAEVIRFLASDGARAINGAALPVGT
jgi:NAD(P)-dependent dehydrogenase (short-subunit alcohol dehydrogenase family)